MSGPSFIFEIFTQAGLISGYEKSLTFVKSSIPLTSRHLVDRMIEKRGEGAFAMTDEEFAVYSLKYKKRFRKKIEKKPQPVKILMNRTINSGLMIVKDIQGIPFERLSFSLYFFCQDIAMKEFTRSYEAQLELAAIDAEKFLNQLHNFYTKISLRIVKEGLYREFFEFVFHCCRLRMEGVMDNGEDKIITAYINILSQTMEYLRPNKIDFSKRVVGLSTNGEVLVADDYVPYYDVASEEVEENVEKIKDFSFLKKTFAKYGMEINSFDDIESIGNQDKVIFSSTLALLLFINEFSYDILPTRFVSSEEIKIADLRSLVRPDDLKEFLRTRRRTLPTNGVEVEFPENKILNKLIMKETLYQDTIYLLYRLDTIDGDYSGYFDTKTGFFYTILFDASSGPMIPHALTSLVLYLYGCCVLDNEEIQFDLLSGSFSVSGTPVIAKSYFKGGQLRNIYRKSTGMIRDDDKYSKEDRAIQGYVRKLPSGQSASEEAKEYAEKLGYNLRSDETFVRPFIKSVYKLSPVK